MEMFTSLPACKCVQRMYQNFSLGVFNSLQGNENQMISFFFFLSFKLLILFFLKKSVIMQLIMTDAVEEKEKGRKGEARNWELPAALES